MTLALFLYLVTCNLKHFMGRHTYVQGVRDDFEWCVVCKMSKSCGATKWFPYDNGPQDFGYAEWRCQLPEGHAGDHAANR